MGSPPLAWSMIAQRSNQSHQRLPQLLSIPIKKSQTKELCPLLESPPSCSSEVYLTSPHPFLLNKACFHSAYSHKSLQLNFHWHETSNSVPLSQVNFSDPWISGTFLSGRPWLSATGHLKFSLFLKFWPATAKMLLVYSNCSSIRTCAAFVMRHAANSMRKRKVGPALLIRILKDHFCVPFSNKLTLAYFCVAVCTWSQSCCVLREETDLWVRVNLRVPESSSEREGWRSWVSLSECRPPALWLQARRALHFTSTTLLCPLPFTHKET